MCVNLSGEYFEHWGERHKLLAEMRKSTASATLDQFCQENAVKTRFKQELGRSRIPYLEETAVRMRS